jgi:hypothetical protein
MIDEGRKGGRLVVTRARKGGKGRKEEGRYLWEAEQFSKLPIDKLPIEIPIDHESSGILCCITFVGNHEKPTYRLIDSNRGPEGDPWRRTCPA